VGSQLAALSGGEFATRADRTNQEKVDAILGTGYKAGSAAANTALRDYYKANPPQSDAQRQELGQKIFNQNMERMRQQAAGTSATVLVPAAASPSSTGPAGSNSGGDTSRDSATGGTPVKSGTGLTWTDSSGNPIRTGVDETALQRLMKLSGQQH
jgi:hypothetical protein